MHTQESWMLRILRGRPVYELASEPSRGLLELVVARISRLYQCTPTPAACGQLGFEPNFARIEHGGRRGLMLRASVYGRPERYREAGLGRILVPARPGYSRVKIDQFEDIALLLEALDLAWSLRANGDPAPRVRRRAQGAAS